MLVDGNDAAAVYAAVRRAVASGAEGGGPTLIEALTYRIEAHTNADDATRYRDQAEVDGWLARDPLARIRKHLIARGLLDEPAVAVLEAEAEAEAAALRQRLNAGLAHDPATCSGTSTPSRPRTCAGSSRNSPPNSRQQRTIRR